MLELSLHDEAGVLPERELAGAITAGAALLEAAKRGEAPYRESLGWLDVEAWAGQAWLQRCEALAAQVQREADVLVIIGIGGSNQAARAVLQALGGRGGPQIVWAGNSISAHSMQKVLRALDGKSVYINVIAKNFETLEPGLGFRVLRSYLRGRYGAAYAGRVFCTGTEGSYFERLAREQGYTFLPFPRDIGGRFTALSPVALFPLAAAGLDIRALAAGAGAMRARLLAEPAGENTALRYAAIRGLLYQKGYRMEMLSFFEPRLFRFAKWWMQLFGESEGKDGKGLYPLFGNFSEDLHSIGQFLQDGSPVIFETFLDVQNSGASCPLPADAVEDRFGYLDGKDLDAINRVAFEATLAAHSSRFPCMRLTVPALDEESFGALFYFFMFSCYLSARLLGVDPFDQPGVEAYKQRMFRALGKGPGTF